MNFKMQGTETMTSYLNRFMLVISQAVDAQIALPEAEKIEILLNGLRESSEYRSGSANLLSQANLNGAITSTQICNELRCYASCQPCEKDDEKAFHVNTAVAKNQGEKGKGQKFKPNNKGTFPKWGCAICDSKDHKTYQCPRKREVQEMIKNKAKNQFKAAVATSEPANEPTIELPVDPRPRRDCRLVFVGAGQRPGIDYDEVFTPTVRMETVRILLALAAKYHWRRF